MKFPPKNRKIIDVIIKLDHSVVGVIDDLQEAGLRKIVFKPIYHTVFGEIEAYKISDLKEVKGVLDVNTKLDQYEP